MLPWSLMSVFKFSKLSAKYVCNPSSIGVTWRERLEGENTLEEDLFALFEDLKNSGPRGNNRVKQVRQSSWMLQYQYHPLPC